MGRKRENERKNHWFIPKFLTGVKIVPKGGFIFKIRVTIFPGFVPIGKGVKPSLKVNNAAWSFGPELNKMLGKAEDNTAPDVKQLLFKSVQT